MALALWLETRPRRMWYSQLSKLGRVSHIDTRTCRRSHVSVYRVAAHHRRHATTRGGEEVGSQSCIGEICGSQYVQHADEALARSSNFEFK